MKTPSDPSESTAVYTPTLAHETKEKIQKEIAHSHLMAECSFGQGDYSDKGIMTADNDHLDCCHHVP